MDKFLENHKTDSKPTKKNPPYPEDTTMNFSKHLRQKQSQSYTNSLKE